LNPFETLLVNSAGGEAATRMALGCGRPCLHEAPVLQVRRLDQPSEARKIAREFGAWT
jgi:hypothetical protein